MCPIRRSISSISPLRSPTAIMWVTKAGNSPLRFNGSAIVSPSRIFCLAPSTACSSTRLFITRFATSMASNNCTPLASMVANVLVSREIATIRATSPMSGIFSNHRSAVSCPASVFIARRTAHTIKDHRPIVRKEIAESHQHDGGPREGLLQTCKDGGDFRHNKSHEEKQHRDTNDQHQGRIENGIRHFMLKRQ